MIPRFFSAIGKEVRGMHEAAYVLAGFALASQLLALLRDRILAASFGASHTLDLYYAAFRVPDFLFATVASLLSLYALLPVLSRLQEREEGMVVSFLRDTLVVFLIGMSFLAAILYLLAPFLAIGVAPGLTADPASRAQLVLLIRILLLQPILLGASNTLASFTQLRHRFILYSVSPLLYNLGIIFGAVVLYPYFGLAGLGWGVVFGAVMHVSIQLPFFFSEKTATRMPIAMMLKEFYQVLLLSIPRTLSLAAGQISLLALVAIASLLSSGSIAIFTFAYNLQAVPLTVIGVSYSIAVFPTLARLHAQGNSGEFKKQIEAALRHVLFWSIPVMVFVIVLRAQLVRVILGAGAFNWDDTRLTAAALALFIISIAAQSMSLVIARAYFAIGNTRKPFYYGLIDVVVSVGSAFAFVAVFHSNIFIRDFIEALFRVSDIPGTTVLMLALGFACGSIAEFAVTFVFFRRDFGISPSSLVRLSFQSLSASILGATVSYGILFLTGVAGTINTTFVLIIQGLVAGITGLIVTVFLLWLLKNPELHEAIAALMRRFMDAPPVVLEPTDVSS